MTTRQPAGRPDHRRSNRPSVKPFALVSRTADGRLRSERFSSAAEYRSRLATCSDERPISLDELIDLLAPAGN